MNIYYEKYKLKAYLVFIYSNRKLYYFQANLNIKKNRIDPWYTDCLHLYNVGRTSFSYFCEK